MRQRNLQLCIGKAVTIVEESEQELRFIGLDHLDKHHFPPLRVRCLVDRRDPTKHQRAVLSPDIESR